MAQSRTRACGWLVILLLASGMAIGQAQAPGFSVEKRGEGWYNGDNGGALMQAVRSRIEQAYRWDALDKPIPRTYGPVVKDGKP